MAASDDFRTQDAPSTLTESGAVPKTRMGNAQAVRERITLLTSADNEGRARRRALVRGLVDGNPPYRASDLKNAGRSDSCNVNWRQAEAILTQAAGAFYDVFSEVPTYADIQLEHEDPELQSKWSRIASSEFHRMLDEDRSWDHTMQVSQENTVLYGRGPQVFQDEFDWRTRAVQDRDLLLPNFASSDTTQWEEAIVLTSLTPDQLYAKIADPNAARAMGWDVNLVKLAIMGAAQETNEQQQHRSWEWYQEKLKTQSLSYSTLSMTIQLAHYYVREFPVKGETVGKITHTVVLSPRSDQAGEQTQGFLFKRERRFDEWHQIIHPMYYDNMGGGKHYAVTGLGVKMYSSLEFQNRLWCDLADKVFAPKLLFKPQSENEAQKFRVMRMGPYGILPAGMELNQTPLAGLVDEGMAFSRATDSNLSANLAVYRQNLAGKEGNPVTATEVNERASQQARLGKTQLNRYYNQMDWLYAEKYRRAAAATSAALPGGKEALAFIKRCKDRGVPVDALRKTRKVSATRIVGQGSEFMRQAALEFILGLAAMLPREGVENLVKDSISARAGVKMVERYYPDLGAQGPSEHLVDAVLQVAAAKVGVAPIVIKDQDHEVFASTFMNAASSAISSVQAGAPANQVLQFVSLLGPAIAQHIQMLAQDPIGKDKAAALEEQWNKLAELVDQLKKHAGQTPQQQKKGADMSFDQKLKMQELKADQERKNLEMEQSNKRSNAKTNQQLETKGRQANQQLAINDIQLAQEIKNDAKKPKASNGK